MSKIAVIGSNSFSGASFVNYALNRRHQIIGLSRSEEPHEAFLPYRSHPNSSQFHFIQADLNRDLSKLMKALDDFEPEYIVDFAAQSMVAQSWKNPDHWYQTNLVGKARLTEEVRQRNYLKRYVHVTTPEVYGSCEGDVGEDHRFNPSTPYAVSRAAEDFHFQAFFQNYGFPVVHTRAANVFGPGQQLYRIVPKTMLSIASGERLPLHGGGVSIRSFIHIDDVSEGTLRLMEDGKNGETYHLSTPRMVSIRELVEMICSMMGVSFDEVVDVAPERAGKDFAYRLSSEKIRNELNWADRISLEEGLEQTLAWVRDHMDELKKQPMEYVHKQ